MEKCLYVYAVNSVGHKVELKSWNRQFFDLYSTFICNDDKAPETDEDLFHIIDHVLNNPESHIDFNNPVVCVKHASKYCPCANEYKIKILHYGEDVTNRFLK